MEENPDNPKVKIKTTPLKPRPEHSQRRFRDINEDDDGYHPYCDGPERDLRHEEDPWV